MNTIEPTPAEYDALGRQLLAAARRTTRRQRTDRQFLAIGIATLAIGSIGGVMLANADFQQWGAYCYSEPSTSSSFITVGSGPNVGPDDEKVPTAPISALEMCEAAWRIGAVGPNVTQPPVDGITYAVPQLQACTRADGVTAVFPIEQNASPKEFCDRQGMTLPIR